MAKLQVYTPCPGVRAEKLKGWDINWRVYAKDLFEPELWDFLGYAQTIDEIHALAH